MIRKGARSRARRQSLPSRGKPSGDPARAAEPPHVITKRKKTEQAVQRREAELSFVLQLNDALRELDDPIQVQVTAARLVGKRLQADRVFYSEIVVEDGIETGVIECDYHRPGVSSLTGRFDFKEFSHADYEDYRAGRTVCSPNVLTDRRKPRQSETYRAVDIAAYIGVPLVKRGELVSVLGVLHTQPRNWTPEEIRLAEQTADRTWRAVQRARADKAVRDSEARLRSVLDSSRDAIYRFNCQSGRYDYISPSGEAITGIPAEEFLSMNIEATLATVHPDDLASVKAGLAQSLETGEVELEYRTRTKSGEYRWVSNRMSVTRDADGCPLYRSGNMRDITERKKAEEALRESEERLRSLAENVPYVLMRFDRQFRIVYLSPQSDRYNTIPVERLLGRTNREVGMPEGLCDVWEAATERVFRTGIQEEMEFDFAGPSGMRTFALKFAPEFGPDQEVRYVLAVSSDITERKRAEEAAAAAHTRIQSIIDNTPAMVYAFDLEGRFVMANAALAELLNSTPEQMIGKRRHEFMPKEDADRHEADDRQAIEAGRALEFEEYNQLKGRSITWLTTKFPLRDAQGRIYGVGGISAEITARKQAEQALRELSANLESKVATRKAELEKERRRLYDVLEAMPAMVCLLTPDYHISFANRSFRERFGDSEGRHCYEHCYGRTQPCEFCESYVVLKTGRPHRWEVTAADGRTIIEAHDYPFTDVDGSPLILEMDLDITERKQAEVALRTLNETLTHRNRQLQRLTLELTQAEERERRRIAVILHEDLQQQIAGARFHLNVVRNRIKEDQQRADIDRVDRALKDAIEQSRNLSHDLSPIALHMSDLAEALRWLVNRVGTQQGLIATVHASGDMTLHSQELAVFLFRAAQEMLFNVIKHADVNRAAVRVKRIRQYICLGISDQGRGFDPKELEATSGMGLFSIRERVELLGGRIKIKSAAGKGSRFCIVVPDNPEDRSQKTAMQGGVLSSRIPPPVASGALRVLLVDDHPVVRAGLAAMLREAPGIELVGEAPDGREAINLAAELRPDVVVMDVSIPLMSGDKAARQIKAYLPKTRVIGLSMYDDAEKKQKMFEAGADAYILKTVSAEKLLDAIRGDAADS